MYFQARYECGQLNLITTADIWVWHKISTSQSSHLKGQELEYLSRAPYVSLATPSTFTHPSGGLKPLPEPEKTCQDEYSESAAVGIES